MPVNDAETKLRHLLLAAGFGEGIRGEQIRLSAALGSTTPDVIYRDEDHEPDEGVCVYLDGLSAHLHGNPETAEQDREIRDWLRNSGYDVIEIAATDLDDQDAMTRHFRRLAQYLGLRDTRSRLRSDPSWFHRAGQSEQEARSRLRLVSPPQATAVRHLRTSGSPARGRRRVRRPRHRLGRLRTEWVELDTSRSLRRGMFVARVDGKSMEPRIPDGSYCLFAAPVTGSRQGRTVLARMLNDFDPDTGQRFTVKRYQSEKATNEDGWRHLAIVLEPLNPDYEPIELTAEDESPVNVIAELIEVIGTEAPIDELGVP